MKPVIILGDNLYEHLLVAITSKPNNPALSFGIDIRFIGDGEIKKAKLVLHTKKTLYESPNKNVLSFTGTLFVTEGAPDLCIGYYYCQEEIQECWLSTIRPVTELFKMNISKTDFIEKCKEYYQFERFEYTEDGNMINTLPIFRNIPKSGGPSGILINQNKTIIFHTEMYKNIFPIEKNGEKDEILFGEYIDEYLIKTYSIDEATLRGLITI